VNQILSGDASVLKADSTFSQLDTRNWRCYIWCFIFFKAHGVALAIEIAGGKSQTRFPMGETLQIVVRAVDNNSDPLSIITIYKFKAKASGRNVVISKDNSGTLMKSRTISKNQVRFSGKKFGKSSYLITLKGLVVGEYGIVVSNPNSIDEKRIVVSCFAVD
jgi:ribosomal protein S6E (S10)